jgi:hypothetical protein
VVDAHPAPYRDPDRVAGGYNNEAANVDSRSLMRDAPFTLQPTIDFTLTAPYVSAPSVQFPGRPAVSVFNDAIGYYPGAEFVAPSPTQPEAWLTKQWDASTVIPAQRPYGIAAPGYRAADELGFACLLNPDGTVSTLGDIEGGLAYDGGTGNPGDYNAQYGWRVELIAEAPDHTWGQVRIYNLLPYRSSQAVSYAQPGRVAISYVLALTNAGTVTQTRQFTYTLDSRLALVSQSWPTGSAPGPAYGWNGTLAPGESKRFVLVADMALAPPESPIFLTTTLVYDDFINPQVTETLVTRAAVTNTVYLPVALK